MAAFETPIAIAVPVVESIDIGIGIGVGMIVNRAQRMKHSRRPQPLGTLLLRRLQVCAPYAGFGTRYTRLAAVASHFALPTAVAGAARRLVWWREDAVEGADGREWFLHGLQRC